MISRLGSSINNMPNYNTRQIPRRWLSVLMLLEPHILHSVAGSAWLSSRPATRHVRSLSLSYFHRSKYRFSSSRRRRRHGSGFTTFPFIDRSKDTGIPSFARSMSSSTDDDFHNKRMKQDALQIIRKSIQAVDPYSSVNSHLRCTNDLLQIGNTQYSLGDYDKIVLIAFGKASSAMATAVVQQLSSSSTSNTATMGICICKDDHATPEELSTLEQFGCKVYEASHPVPDERSSEAAQRALEMVQQEASSQTLVLCCISGGGSALFCQPHENLSLQDLQETNQALLASGMSIQDCNVIRKRLEQGKGGRLALACHPSQLVTLVLSDGASLPQKKKTCFLIITRLYHFLTSTLFFFPVQRRTHTQSLGRSFGFDCFGSYRTRYQHTKRCHPNCPTVSIAKQTTETSHDIATRASFPRCQR